MLEQSLNGARGVWQFREAGQGEWMPAEAPGCNYGDLLALGKIPDPFIGQNEEKSKWVAERDWEYRRQEIRNRRFVCWLQKRRKYRTYCNSYADLPDLCLSLH